ncbi:MAG: twin-arginine translocation signal domain-containing protein [Trueperaceae bacterium]|nr:twin-arginine translocation signal domain-containing protein [Trueperaceae bacterium]
MNRREFLAYCAATGVGVTLAGAGWHYFIAASNAVAMDDAASYAERLAHLQTFIDDPDEARVLALLPAYESAAAIGEHVDGGASDEALVLRRLKGKLIAAPTDSGADGYEALRARLDAHVREDFTADRVVLLDGWLLSETSIDLCLLAAVVEASTRSRWSRV